MRAGTDGKRVNKGEGSRERGRPHVSYGIRTVYTVLCVFAISTTVICFCNVLFLILLNRYGLGRASAESIKLVLTFTVYMTNDVIRDHVGRDLPGHDFDYSCYTSDTTPYPLQYTTDRQLPFTYS